MVCTRQHAPQGGPAAERPVGQPGTDSRQRTCECFTPLSPAPIDPQADSADLVDPKRTQSEPYPVTKSRASPLPCPV